MDCLQPWRQSIFYLPFYPQGKDVSNRPVRQSLGLNLFFPVCLHTGRIQPVDIKKNHPVGKKEARNADLPLLFLLAVKMIYLSWLLPSCCDETSFARTLSSTKRSSFVEFKRLTIYEYASGIALSSVGRKSKVKSNSYNSDIGKSLCGLTKVISNGLPNAKSNLKSSFFVVKGYAWSLSRFLICALTFVA